MELRQLEYFQMVCRLSSISKAAEALHIAQPSVSIAIHKLEEELGIQLFDRSQRQISLTPEGTVFSLRTNEILTRIGDILTEINDLRLLQKGSIKIGIPPMIGVFLFPYIFAQFRLCYPDIEITAVEGGSLYIQSLLEQGRIDIGIITKSNTPAYLQLSTITTGQIYACLHSGHPLNSLAAIPFTKLRDESFVLLKEDTYNRMVVLEECKKNNFTPRIAFTSSQLNSVIALVEQGVGITFLFDAIARKHSGIIESRPLSDPLHYEIVLAWNPNRYISRAAKEFIDFIISTHYDPAT